MCGGAGTRLWLVSRESMPKQFVRGAVAGLSRDVDFLRLAAEAFTRAPKKSIDYAVMVRTRLAAVVAAADLGWSDIGSWSAVCNVLSA
jgi:mannose-1-phosphate guanylyltransferase / mannose-6-phosphate isomerase